MDPAVLIAAAALLCAPAPPPLRGCLEPQHIISRLSELRSAKWQEWTRDTVRRTWPNGLKQSARDYYTTEVVGFSRLGRLVEGRLECGESYLFHPPTSASGDYLRELHVTHAELFRSDALLVAKLFANAIDPPPNAGPAETICFDCGDPGEQLASRQWTRDGEVNVMQIYLHGGVGTQVVEFVWSRRPAR